MSLRAGAAPHLVRSVLLAGGLALLAPICLAQHGGGGGGGRPPGGMPGGGDNGYNGGFPRGNGGPPPDATERGGVSTMRGGLQLGPPGRWWDDKHFAKDLKLRPDQQHRMDAVFESNRPSLLRRFQDLRAELIRMETLTHAKTLDEGTLFAEIDRIAQARADLEKANTHLLLQIRAEMDVDQIERMEQRR